MEMQMYVRSCLERRRNYQDTHAYLTLNDPRFISQTSGEKISTTK